METIKSLDKETITTLGTGTIEEFAESLGMIFINKKNSNNNVCFADVDELRSEYRDVFYLENLYDYLYAVWYSLTSLETQNEYLQINFKDIPIPNDKKKFWELVQFGEELRQVDLFQ